MKHYAIIVAGGKGLRMGADLPKQFLSVGGKPVLMHTIERFRAFDAAMGIILVLPREQQDYWRGLCREYAFDVDHLVVDGGETRFHSSLHGLQAIPETVADGLVGIHDGVRPFPAIDTIRRCYEAAAQTGAAIPVVPVVDTLRKVNEERRMKNEELGNEERRMKNEECPAGSQADNSSFFILRSSFTFPRSDYRIVQTPQEFSIGLLREAFRQPYSPMFTDDASVVEAIGHPITLVEGNRENIKLTTPFDLTVAQAIISS